MKMLKQTAVLHDDSRRWLGCGPTPALAIPELSAAFGLRNLIVKDESANPFGTHKDRKSEYLVRTVCQAKGGRKPDAFSIITSGNAGVSLAAFASSADIPVIAVVDSLPEENLAQLRRSCRQVLRVDLQERVWTSRDLRQLMHVHGYARTIDASNCAAAYAGMAFELAELKPDIIVLPVGSGELFVGLARVIRACGLNTRLYGATVTRRNSIADKLVACWTPYKHEVSDVINDSRVGHRLFELDDEAGLQNTYELVRRYLRCEPSSALAFHLLRHEMLPSTATVVVVNTGKVRLQSEIESAWA